MIDRSGLPEWYSNMWTDAQLRLPARQRWMQLVTHPDLELDPTAQHIALVLAAVMDGDGATTPVPLAEIARQARRSKRTVQRAIARLVDAQLLGRGGRGQHHPDRYRARIPDRDPFTHSDPVVSLDPARGDSHVTPGPVDIPSRGDTHDTPEPVDNPPGVTSETPGVTNTTLRGDTGVTQPGFIGLPGRAGARAHACAPARDPHGPAADPLTDRDPRQPPLVADASARRSQAADRLRRRGLDDTHIAALLEATPPDEQEAAG